jgi:hypothetical protein
MEAGFAFSQGPKDAMAAAVKKNLNHNLGPGTHKIVEYGKKEWSSRAGTMGKPKEPKGLPDNGVPGPGTHNPETQDTIPSFKICKDTEVDESRKRPNTVAIGPQQYYPQRPQEGQPGTRMCKAVRKEDKTFVNVPGPNRYQILGDFDFRDPNVAEDRNRGKLPKFAFGIKTVIKNSNQDVPGPGTYEVDQYPMNQKNISYWIGTDVRKDLGVPYAKDFPGPGFYEHGQQMHPGAYIS